MYTKPRPRPAAPFSEKLTAWFAGRGISPATLTEMKVTEGKEDMPRKNGKYAPMNTVQFNYYCNGELVNTKFRTGDKCFKMVSGAKIVPYHIDAIKDESECIVTEGEIDALSFYECGRHNVVSVPNGANANLTYLDPFIESHFENKEVIYIASDTDTKGVLLRNELLRRFGPERCRIVEYGEGCKDANEHLVKYGRESLMACLANATEPKIEGVFTVKDYEAELDALYEHGMQKGVTIGHANFDKLCSFETKRLCVVTGIPGSGKTSFINEMIVRLNLLYGWKAALFSPENAPFEYLAGNLIEMYTGKKFGKDTLPFLEFQQVKEFIGENMFTVLPKENFRLSSILDRARQLVRRKGIRVLVIDPYNRLENENTGQNETQYISKQLDMLTNFAQQNDVLVMLMAHPTKQQKNAKGSFDAPTLYDISGSANFYNKADYGIVVHRNRDEGTVSIHVQKVKFRHLGHNGEAQFKYNLDNGRYVPYEEGKEPQWDNSNFLEEYYRKRATVTVSPAEPDFGGTDGTGDCPF